MKKELTEHQIYYKWDQKTKQKFAVLDRKYSKMIELRKDKLESKKEKECQRVYSKFSKLRDIELHNLTAKRKKKIPTKPDTPKARQEAYRVFQLWRKMNLSDKQGMVWLAESGTLVHYKDCVAGHIYSKVNHPNLAFEPINVWCITNETNRKQGTSPGVFRAINILTNKELKELKDKSEDKSWKSEKRDGNYYRAIIEKYTDLIEIEKKRLGLI